MQVPGGLFVRSVGRLSFIRVAATHETPVQLRDGSSRRRGVGKSTRQALNLKIAGANPVGVNRINGALAQQESASLAGKRSWVQSPQAPSRRCGVGSQHARFSPWRSRVQLLSASIETQRRGLSSGGERLSGRHEVVGAIPTGSNIPL